MEKIAFIFPGHGTQYMGMGKDFYKNTQVGRETFEIIDSIRKRTSNQCFYCGGKNLSVIENVHPCIYSVEMAIANTLRADGILPDMVAGLSVGEVAALTCANVFNLERGFRFICRSVKELQSNSEVVKTATRAVIHMNKKHVDELCKIYKGIYPAVYISETRTVVTGEKELMKDFSKAVKQEGGKTVLLGLCGGFHSPYMELAAEKMHEDLDGRNFGKPTIPVYSNCTGKLYSEKDDIPQLLSDHVKKPILWENTILDMIDKGVDTFVEIGPGSVLTHSLRKISNEVKRYNIENVNDLLEFEEDYRRSKIG